MSEKIPGLVSKAESILATCGTDQDLINEAIDLYSEALKLSASTKNPFSIDFAGIYYGYGDALLRDVENDQLLSSGMNTTGSMMPIASNKPLSDDIQNTEQAKAAHIDLDVIVDEDSSISEEEEEEDSAPIQKTKRLDSEKEIDNDPSNEADDVENLELAWEALETARDILSDSLDTQLKDKEKGSLIDAPQIISNLQLYVKVYLRLGDCGLAQSQKEQAVEDYTKAMNLLTLYKPELSREVSSCHLNIAEALEGDVNRAMPHYEASLRIILLEIAKLKEKRGESGVITQDEKNLVNLKEDIELQILEFKKDGNVLGGTSKTVIGFKKGDSSDSTPITTLQPRKKRKSDV
ncbi:hypothetical protein BLNAU_15987 [Blattamonas nauphoetae]|uniref:Tetratricopeptide SHNi-TPR domain-containing protein n=1 Tax=Blattamonas nauphoetae TaxID=2049346 RepID=A0ABQ9XCN7_9EUKA|nr:hypothetical protein BLNAU_15987 [Blattamonas nauphoetae]